MLYGYLLALCHFQTPSFLSSAESAVKTAMHDCDPMVITPPSLPMSCFITSVGDLCSV